MGGGGARLPAARLRPRHRPPPAHRHDVGRGPHFWRAPRGGPAADEYPGRIWRDTAGYGLNTKCEQFHSFSSSASPTRHREEVRPPIRVGIAGPDMADGRRRGPSRSESERPGAVRRKPRGMRRCDMTRIDLHRLGLTRIDSDRPGSAQIDPDRLESTDRAAKDPALPPAREARPGGRAIRRPGAGPGRRRPGRQAGAVSLGLRWAPGGGSAVSGPLRQPRRAARHARGRRPAPRRSPRRPPRAAGLTARGGAEVWRAVGAAHPLRARTEGVSEMAGHSSLAGDPGAVAVIRVTVRPGAVRRLGHGIGISSWQRHPVLLARPPRGPFLRIIPPIVFTSDKA